MALGQADQLDELKTFTDFLRWRKEYSARAGKRFEERLNSGDDTGYYDRVIEEMIFDMENRLRRMEKAFETFFPSKE